MSEEKRDYPEWLDKELFDGADKTAGESPLPEATRVERAGADKDAEAPKARKKTAEKDAEAPKARKKSADKDAEAPKTAKKAAAASSADAPVKKKKKKAAPAGDGKDAGTKKKSADAKSEGAPEGKKKKKSRKKARGGLIALIVLISLAVILCAAAAVGGYLISKSETNLPNVYIGDVYVGGMTKEQTVQALRDADWEKTTGGTLTVKLPEGVSFEADYLKGGVASTAEEEAELAYEYGHTGEWIDDLVTYIGDLLIPKDLRETEFAVNNDYVAEIVDKAVDEFEEVTKGEEYSVNEEESTLEVVKGAGQITLDRKALRERVAKALMARETAVEWNEITGEIKKPDFAAIAAELTSEVKNAYYDREKDEIIPDVKGVDIDMVKAEQLWEQAEVLEKISIPITLVDPEITAESLRELLFRDQLGSCQTFLWGSSANRISNIRLACSRFDNLILLPGEHFSYNATVGERTEESGFKLAPVYSGTDHQMGYGGGICQVSSTLYNAVLASDLQVDARTCHSMIVGYLPIGLDATVDWPDTDFAFTNSRDYPVKLRASVDDRGRSVTIEIWGTNLDGSYVEPRSASWKVYDDTYPDVQVAWGAASYKYYFDKDGNQINMVKVDNSYYHIPDDEIDWPAESSGSDGGDDGDWEEELPAESAPEPEPELPAEPVVIEEDVPMELPADN